MSGVTVGEAMRKREERYQLGEGRTPERMVGLEWKDHRVSGRSPARRARCVVGSMVAALPLVYVLEQLLALVKVDAALEDSRDAPPVQLLVDDRERFGATLNPPFLYFFFG